jgi:hypothetical protein
MDHRTPTKGGHLMLHQKRRWLLSTVASAEELARMLTQTTYTLCSGFYVAGHGEYLFLNDATHEDCAGEYACVKSLGPSEWIQLESITFSWCSTERALDLVRAALAGEFDANDFARKIDLAGKLDAPAQHGRCHLCA